MYQSNSTSGRELTPPGIDAILTNGPVVRIEFCVASCTELHRDEVTQGTPTVPARGLRAARQNGMRSRYKNLGRYFRRTATFVVLPLLQAPEEVLMGGQAVIEGVMMRSPHSFAVAVRQPGGALAVTQDFLERPSEKYPSLKYPVLRGLGTLGQALVLGIRALRYSAEQALEEPQTAQGAKKPGLSNWLLALNLAFSLGFFIFFYKFLPLYLATTVNRLYPATNNTLVFNLLDGTIRIVLFLGFLFVVAQWKEIQRVFEYHGAEHKVVWAFEKHGPVDVANARACARFHPRCGTSFLLVVMGIAMVLYMFLPFRSFGMRFLGRILLLPLIAGVAYEFIRLAARARGRLWRITTREPDDRQLETAIKALETALELEKSRGGELAIA